MTIQQSGTIPHNAHEFIEGRLWIFGFGTLYKTKNEANKDRDQIVREYVKQFEFFGQIWFIRLSSHALNTVKRMGYCPIN